MAQAIGWGALPIGVSLRGLQGEIDKKLRRPLEKASREAGEAASRNLTKAAEQAAKAVEAAKGREKKALEEVAKAEDKLAQKRSAQDSQLKAIESAEKKLQSAQEQRLQKVAKAESDYESLRKSGKATTDELQQAEAKLAQARLDADAKVIDRENALEAARRRSESAASRVASAEESLAAAKKRAADASDAVVAKTAQQDKAQSDLNARAKEGTWLLDRLGVELADVDDAMERASSSTKGFAGHVWDASKKIGALAAGMAGIAGVAGTLQKGFAKVTSIEDTTKSLGILMGDTQRATDLMQDLQDTNQNTPYAFDAWAGAGKKLVAFGVEAEEVSRTVTALGEAASASGKGEEALNSMSEAMGQAAASGKLSMDTLNRLSDGGVQGLKILANAAGVTTEEMQKSISAGKVSAIEGIQALTDGILEGSDGINGAVSSMSGVMGEMAETTSGRLTNMQAAFNNLAAEIFKQINPIINVLAEKVTAWTYEFIGVLREDLIPAIQSLGSWVQENAAVLGALGGSIGIVVGALKVMKLQQDIVMAGGFLKWLMSFDKLTLAAARAQRVLNFAMSTNPIALLIKGFVLLAGGLAVFFTKTETGRKVWADFTEKIGELWDQAVGRIQDGLERAREFFAQSGIRDAVMSIGESLKSAFGSVKSALADLGQSLGGAVFDVLKGLFGLLQDLWPVLEVIGKIVGGVLVVQFMAAVKAIQLVTWALSGVLKAFSWLIEKALAPVLSFVGSFVGAFLNDIVPALTWFAGIIGTVVGGAFQLLGTVISGTWNNVIKPVFDALVTVGKWMAQILGTVVISPILIAWNLMSEGIQWAWENRIKPTFDLLAAAATWLWQNALVPAFDGIKWAFEQMGNGLQWVYDNVITPVFDFFKWYAEQVWNNAQIAFEGIRWAFEQMGNGLRWVNDNVIQPVWDAFGAGLTWLHDNVVSPVTGWIGNKWSQLGDGMGIVKDWIVDKVFGGFQRGLDTLKGWVGTTADAMGRLWDGIKRKFAEPINFVIRVVYNDGIKKVFDGVAEKVGLDARLPAIPTVGGYASGGVLPGYTPGRDPYTFVEPRTGMSIGLSGGEAILRPEATRALGPQWVDNINRAARYGGETGVAKSLMDSHFASGGIVHLGNFANGGFTNLAGALSAVQQSMGNFVGRFFPGMFNLTSATRPGDPGFHGRGLATDWQAKDGQYQTQMPTPQSKALARAIYTNFRNSTELIHWPLDGWENLKWGNPITYPAGTNAQHGNHVHWAIQSPLRFDGDDIVLDDVPGAGGSHFSPLGFFNGLWDRIVGKLPSFDLSGYADLAKVPGAALKTLGGWVKDWALETLKEWGNKFLNMVGLGKRPAAEWSDMALEALKRMGYGPEHLQAMLQQIEIESGGDPNAVNNWDSNAAQGTPSGGLLQVIEPTYQDVRRRYPEAFEGLPDDRMHPMTNLVAGVGAVKRDWGGPAGRWPTRGGYANGGVLPGFTPGVDVHQFYSPTAGWLGLSGGESIMVPEWTAMQGGPAAVERMNRAARAGRSSSARGGQAFADGGVFGSARGGFDAAVASLQAAADEIQSAFAGNDQGYDALAATLRNEQWAKAIVDGAAMLGKIADYSSVEGVAARSFASEVAEIAGMLGGKTISTVTSSLLDAEKQIWDARAGSADRLAAVAEKERALEEARRAAADAASAEMSEESKKRIADAEEAVKRAREDGNADKVAEAEKKLADVRKETSEKSAEDVTKANEQVVKAEQELSAARKAAAQALDIPIHTIAPQISGMLMAASAATVSIPPLSASLAGLAAVVGPAGITVGVVLESLKAALSAAQKIATAIDALVGRVMKARIVAFDGVSQMYEGVRGLSELARQFRQDVTSATFAQAMAVIALADAQRNQRIVAMQGMQAQLDGALKVAEAERSLRESRERDARAQRLLNRDLTESWGGLRHAILQATLDSVAVTAYKSQETLAWEAKLSAAELDLQILQAQGASANLKAQYDATVAAFDLRDATRDLGVAAEKLALMTGETFGTTEVEATVGKRWSDLQAEKAELQAWKAELGTWVNPANWGAMKDADRRIAQIDAELADLESREQFTMDAETQREIERVVKRAGMMGFFGAGDNVARRLENSALGDASRALERIQWESALIDLEAATDAAKLRDDYDRQRAELDFTKQSKPLEVEVAGLEMMRDSFLTTAQYYEADNDAKSRQLLEQLARTQMAHGQEIVNLSRGDSKVVQMPDEKRSYTAEEVEWMLGELDVRVEKLERPQPSAAMVAAYQRAGY